MDIKIETSSIFHSVGQGLFYSEQLNLRNIENNSEISYNIIFDCGSERKTKVEKEIDNYFNVENYDYRYSDHRRKEIKTIDLLVISHLHYDHISGLEYLLKEKRIKITQIVLPYLSPEERIICGTQFLSKISANVDNWYLKFISNPSQYLQEFDIENITMIEGNNENDNIHNSNINDNRIFDNDNFNSEKKINNNLTNVTQKTKQEIEDEDGKINSKKVKLKQGGGYLLFSNLWYSTFFNYKIPHKQKENLKKGLKLIGIENNKDLIRVRL